MNTTFKGQVDIYNPDYRVQSWKGNPNKVMSYGLLALKDWHN